MIRGCLAWQRQGLAPPTVVRDATEAFLEAEDSLALWLSECCEAGGMFDWVSITELWKNWKQWAETAGEKPGNKKGLSEILKNRGFEPKRQVHTGQRGFTGLRLRHAEPSGG